MTRRSTLAGSCARGRRARSCHRQWRTAASTALDPAHGVDVTIRGPVRHRQLGGGGAFNKKGGGQANVLNEKGGTRAALPQNNRSQRASLFIAANNSRV